MHRPPLSEGHLNRFFTYLLTTLKGLTMNHFNTPSTTPDHLLEGAAPILNQAAKTAEEALDSGLQSVRKTAEQLRQQAAHANEVAVGYIRQEPVKAVLIAAATGAALMALVSLFSRGGQRRS